MIECGKKRLARNRQENVAAKYGVLLHVRRGDDRK
jgi:hypothetical protein